YADINWDSSKATATGSIQYGSVYSNGHDASALGSGEIDDGGGFSGSLSPLGGGLIEVFSVPMRATQSGEVTFTASPADVFPAHDVLVYGFNGVVLPENIHFGSALVMIAAPPPGVTLDNGVLSITGSTNRDQLKVNVGTRQ